MKKGVLLFLVLVMVAGLISCKSSTTDPNVSSDPNVTPTAEVQESPVPEGVIKVTIRPMINLVVDQQYGLRDLSDIKVKFHFTKGTEEKTLERQSSISGLVLNAGVVFNVANGESIRIVVSTAPAAIKNDTVAGRLWSNEDFIIEMDYGKIKESSSMSKFTWTPTYNVELKEVK
jgi:hypothetical protein